MDCPPFPPLLVLIHRVSTLKKDSQIADLVHRHITRTNLHTAQENDNNVEITHR